jgi:hypothetical protein
MTSVIYIDKEGNISGLADDLIDKLNLGQKKVARVSNIEYDHNRDEWVAVTLDGLEIGASKVRSEVIDIERAYLNKQIERSFAQK